jgi:phytoene dehydrogenase-like protein
MVHTAIVGAGFGGLAVALRLAEQGAKVALFETLNYAGGCASTFRRKGHAFESGATLFSGFGDGELFARWIDAHSMGVTFERLDPTVVLRAPGLELPISPSRDVFVRTLTQLPAATSFAPQIEAFFREQKVVADALWALFRNPSLLPPFGFKELLVHAKASPGYLPLIRLVGRSLHAMLDRHGLTDCKPLRIFLDAVCQITVQCSAAEAEAPFALGAMDYYFRGTGHVHGGIGTLATAMVDAIRKAGGEVHLACSVRGIRQASDGFELETRRGVYRAQHLALNVLPQAVSKLLSLDSAESQRMHRHAARIEEGWGAVMLYRVLAPGAALAVQAHHLELVADENRAFTNGNHVFCSVSAASERERVQTDGARTVTMSTHVAMKDLLRLSDNERAALVRDVQEQMRDTVRARAPELAANVQLEMPASPRTFERFTQRPFGYVGGIPRRVGLSNYAQLLPLCVRRGVYLVGDSYFPGQSTLAVALGGVKVADALLNDSR